MTTALRPARWFAVVVVMTAATAVACGGGASGSVSSEAGDATSGGDETAANDPQLQVPSETCSAAPVVGQGRYAGTLRDRGPDPALDGVCGGGGPDVFLRVEVPMRADLQVEAIGVGFTPRISLAPPGCLKVPMLVCDDRGVAGLDDVSEGTEVTLAIGVDPAVFTTLSGVSPKEGEADPLAFTVDVGMRRVLAAGEVCMPDVRGRCGAGTLCLPEISAADTDTGGEADAPWTCTPAEGDGCIDPEQVTVQLVDGVASIAIDPELPQSDVHRHSCMDAGMRERVLQLMLPELDPQDTLQLHVAQAEVGLALRAPGCLAGEELACMAPRPSGAQIVLDAPEQLRQAGVAPYLFVELPEPGVLDEPVIVTLRRVLRAPPVSAGN